MIPIIIYFGCQVAALCARGICELGTHAQEFIPNELSRSEMVAPRGDDRAWDFTLEGIALAA